MESEISEFEVGEHLAHDLVIAANIIDPALTVIEQKLAVGFLAALHLDFAGLKCWNRFVPFAPGAHFADLPAQTVPGLVVVPQVWIGDYQVDFLVTAKFGRCAAAVVECDGHDFHERTKEQAEHDKARDRWFAGQDYTVLRFTGSEVSRSPRACAVEALTTLKEKAS